MTVDLPPALERVARVNPVRADDELGKSPVARMTLERIVLAERSVAGRRARRHGRRVVIGALAVLLLAVGAAFAATDPLGLFRSPNPGTAIFGVDRSRHVTPPTEQRIACPPAAGQTFVCASGLRGQRYTLIEHVQSNGPPLTRGGMQAALRHEVRAGRISARGAKRIDDDLAAVSDDFLARLNVMLRFATVSTNLTPQGTRQLAPAHGVPPLLVCEPGGAALRCRDLNGDDSAAIGSGIYQALPAPDWRPAPPHQPDPSGQLEVAILGHTPTAAEQRLLIDLLSTATASTSGPRSPPVRAERTRRPTRSG